MARQIRRASANPQTSLEPPDDRGHRRCGCQRFPTRDRDRRKFGTERLKPTSATPRDRQPRTGEGSARSALRRGAGDSDSRQAKASWNVAERATNLPYLEPIQLGNSRERPAVSIRPRPDPTPRAVANNALVGDARGRRRYAQIVLMRDWPSLAVDRRIHLSIAGRHGRGSRNRSPSDRPKSTDQGRTGFGKPPSHSLLILRVAGVGFEPFCRVSD